MRQITHSGSESRIRKWLPVLVISATVGFVADITGLGICGVSYFWHAGASHTLNMIGTWMIVIGLPFIFISAHCLDKIEGRRRN